MISHVFPGVEVPIITEKYRMKEINKNIKRRGRSQSTEPNSNVSPILIGELSSCWGLRWKKISPVQFSHFPFLLGHQLRAPQIYDQPSSKVHTEKSQSSTINDLKRHAYARYLIAGQPCPSGAVLRKCVNRIKMARSEPGLLSLYL